MSTKKAKMDALDEMVQDIDSLPDDLYLDDVGGDKPGKKYVDWAASRNGRNMGSRGRGKPKKRKFVRSLDDDLLDLDEHDLNALENWDIDDEELYALEREAGVPKKTGFRGRGVRGRGATPKRNQFKRGGGQKQFRGEGFERTKPPEDIFDIESKSHNRRFNWNRVGGYVQDEGTRKTGDNAERDEPCSPGYMTHRKDPRPARQVSDPAENRFPPLRNDPRQNMPNSSAADNMYAPARKDPRLVPQQALPQRQPRNDPRFKPFDSRFSMRKDLRLSVEKSLSLDLGPPGVEAAQEPMPSIEKVPMIHRGPRSPSPPPPLRISGDRSLSPSSRRGRPLRERSHSPRRHSIHHDGLSPRRREWEGVPRERGSPNWSPGRHARRDRSLSPRGRHRPSREWSGSPRRGHSREGSPSSRRDRSLSPRTRLPSFSPPRHRSLSASRDESWRRSHERGPVPPRYGQMQQHPQQSYDAHGPPPPSNVYNEGNYSGSTSTAPTYNSGPAPPSGYSNYQQYSGYDNYYQQPPPLQYSGDYVPPAPQPPSWPEGGMVYPDVSQPPPVQIPQASGTAAPATATMGTSQSALDPKSEEAKKEAVKNEMIQQKQTLSKQREEYVRKKTLISRELELLREQEEELLEENLRENDRILKENHKLQMEIQNKLKAINNVIDMLTGIIGDKEHGKASHKNPDKKPKTPPETPPSSPEPVRVEIAEGESSKHVTRDKPVYNYVHYDPEMHWCRVCDVFPRTAKEYLNHLHSVEHKEETLERKLVDMPWHKIQADEEILHIPGAPTKRTPIRGLQFFISATAWYCKLCDTWIGDLHCASLHLKAKHHSENYSKFTEQNPHWETDWLADRERAYERCSEERRRLKEEKDLLPPGTEGLTTHTLFSDYSKDIKIELKDEKYDLKLKRKMNKERKKMKKYCITAVDEPKKRRRRKKKKMKKLPDALLEIKSSSSSGSNSTNTSSEGDSDPENEDKSKSIRVTMRNKTKGVHDQLPLLPRSRWDSPPEVKHEDVVEHEKEAKNPMNVSAIVDDKLIREWMTTSKEVTDGEKQLLNSIKDRLRQKQEADRERERERRDDRRDSRRGRRRSEKSPDERRERSRFDRYERHDPFRKSPERPARRESSSKMEQKLKEESEVKVSERKSDMDKKPLTKLDEEEYDDEEESAESKFEKQTAESAAKLLKKAKKQPAVMAIPKSKLPFIGRMPILKHFAKKKKPGDSKTESSDNKQIPEDPLVQAQYKLEFTNVGGKVHIGPQESTKSKGSGVIGPELPPASSVQQTEHEVQDMEIDEDTSNSDVPPPAIETPAAVETNSAEQPTKKASDIPLPKDFQDALDILFPGQDSTEKKEENGTSSSGVIQSGPKPPSIPQSLQQSHWPPGAANPQMGGPSMIPPMQNYGGQGPPPPMIGGGGPRMMRPMHGMHGPPHPNMPGPPQGMYGPPFGMPMPGPMMGPPRPPNMMPKGEPPVRHPPPPPPKESRPQSPVSKETPSKKETSTARKSDVAGEMSADELAMMGIDAEDMAAQSF